MVKYAYPHFKREILMEDMGFHGGPEPGEQMPDFDLPTTEGGRVRKSDFLGVGPLLLTFGSATCPMTATAGPVLKKLYEEFGDRVEFVTLYVREAHPSERYPQPKNIDQKMQYARIYKERDDIPWTVAVDDVNGELHRKLDPRSNAAYIVDTDGAVVFRSLWSNDEQALREGLEAVVSGMEAPAGERQSKVVPILKGTGELYDTLKFSGPVAEQDFSREVPGMYALARLAAVFRPLPPYWRGIVAAVVGLTALFGAAFGLSAALRRDMERQREEGMSLRV